jgi:hypothetical protein
LIRKGYRFSILKNNGNPVSQSGAFIGDMFMSPIHTCNLGGVNPFDSLVALQKLIEESKERTGQWSKNLFFANSSELAG